MSEGYTMPPITLLLYIAGCLDLSRRREVLVEDRCKKSDTPTTLAEIREAMGYRH